jgi:predicted enzyme related to lactoylglutathione lyase
MGRVIHFEIPADDLNRARAFYEGVFGWGIQKWDGGDYWLVSTGTGNPGINGGLMKRNEPGQPVVNTVEVTDLEETQAKIRDAGGQVVVPRMEIPGVGYLIYFKDTEGNIFGAMQPKE